MMRVSKLQKLFKLLKVPRFLKIFSLKSRMQSSYRKFYSTTISSDNLVFILLLLGFFCHFAACSWILVTEATLDALVPSWIEA